MVLGEGKSGINRKRRGAEEVLESNQPQKRPIDMRARRQSAGKHKGPLSVVLWQGFLQSLSFAKRQKTMGCNGSKADGKEKESSIDLFIVFFSPLVF